jgi:hypothetical protein
MGRYGPKIGFTVARRSGSSFLSSDSWLSVARPGRSGPDFRFWPLADILEAAANVRFWTQSGHQASFSKSVPNARRARVSMSASVKFPAHNVSGAAAAAD